MKKLLKVVGAFLLLLGGVQSTVWADADSEQISNRPGGMIIDPSTKRYGTTTGTTLQFDHKGISAKMSSLTLTMGGTGLMMNGTVDTIINTNGIELRGTSVTLTLGGAVGIFDTVTMPLYGPKRKHVFSTIVSTGAVGIKPEASWIIPIKGTVTDVRFYAQSQPNTSGLTLNVLMDGVAMYAIAASKPYILGSTSSSVVGTLTTSSVTLNAMLQITVEVQDGVGGTAAAKNIIAAVTIEEDRLLRIDTDVSSVLIGKAATMSDIRAYAGTAPTGTGLTLRVNVNGTAAGTLVVATSASVSNTLTSGVAVAEGDRVNIDVIGIGSTIAGGNVMVTYTLRRVNF